MARKTAMFQHGINGMGIVQAEPLSRRPTVWAIDHTRFCARKHAPDGTDIYLLDRVSAAADGGSVCADRPTMDNQLKTKGDSNSEKGSAFASFSEISGISLMPQSIPSESHLTAPSQAGS